MTTAPQTLSDYRYQTCMDEVTALIRAQTPIIWVVTHEEQRFIEQLKDQVATPTNRQMYLWSAHQGLLKSTEYRPEAVASGAEKDTIDPRKALAYITAQEKPSNSHGSIFILKDFHIAFAEPVPRQIRDIYPHLQDHKKTLLIVSAVLAHGPGGSKEGIPPSLEKQIHIVNFNLPGHDQIKSIIQDSISQMKKTAGNAHTTRKLDYTDLEWEEYTRALTGLTKIEIEDSVATSMVHLKRLDVRKLINDKRQIIRKSQILEFVDTEISMNDVGGLDQAKAYLTKYARAHSPEAIEYGVEPLKGLLLTGVPGTGKSLLAKAVASLWHMPLLRLDVGKVMTGLVGGSEGKMREVINQAEAMAPCILWLDEVEKSLSGTKSSNFSDGGTLARVFGTLLTAMQDGLTGVTIVATANDISMLPPEFIRRFNEVFFVDLPGPEERWEIFGIHFGKRKRNVDTLLPYKDEILEASKDYTGAEIEKAIKDAVAKAFYESKPNVTHQDVIDALKDTKPIARIMSDKVTSLREKARGQYRFASSWSSQSTSTSKKGKELNVSDAVGELTELVKTKKEKAKKTAVESESRFEQIDE